MNNSEQHSMHALPNPECKLDLPCGSEPARESGMSSNGHGPDRRFRAAGVFQRLCSFLKIGFHNNNKIAALRGSPTWPHLLRRCPTTRSSRPPGNVAARSASTTRAPRSGPPPALRSCSTTAIIRWCKTTHQEVLPYYENILSNSNCLIMLADNQGRVLGLMGHTALYRTESGPGLSGWGELDGAQQRHQRDRHRPGL